jgi:hypothetical protein
VSKKVVVRHFHEGNDANRQIRGKNSPYATQARVVDLSSGETLAEEWAVCSPLDVPSRASGRFVSVGRLIKHHPEAVFGASFGVLEYLNPN